MTTGDRAMLRRGGVQGKSALPFFAPLSALAVNISSPTGASRSLAPGQLFRQSLLLLVAELLCFLQKLLPQLLRASQFFTR
jgi:hypothetical protein